MSHKSKQKSQAKTKLVNGVRVNIQTGRPAFRNTMSQQKTLTQQRASGKYDPYPYSKKPPVYPIPPASQIQMGKPDAPLGSTARTNQLLGGEYFKGETNVPSNGISLPDDPNSGNLGGGSESSESQFNLPSLLSASATARDERDLAAQTKKELSGARSKLGGKFDIKIGDFGTSKANVNRGLAGQLGTNRRQSTSGREYLKFIGTQYDKKIADLEVQKEEALDDFDLETAKFIESKLERLNKEKQQEFANALSLIDYEKKIRELDATDPERVAERQGQVIDLFQSGFTSADDIFEMINYNDNGDRVNNVSLSEITSALEEFKTDSVEIDKLLTQIAGDGAPPDVIEMVANSRSLAEAVTNAGDHLISSRGGIIGEYLYYKRQAAANGQVPVDFNTYQDMDANRKRLANSTLSGAGLTPVQERTFLRISDKFQADSVIKVADKGKSAIDIANRVIADPSSAGNQLMILYTLVKNLDPDSAVREGELDLASKTQSYMGKFGTTLDRIGQGRLVSDAAVLELAEASKVLAEEWYEAGSRRQKQYRAQAQIANVGDAFDQYLGAFDRPYEELEERSAQAKTSVESYLDSNPGQAGWIAQMYEDLNASDIEIYEYLKLNGLVQ